ncbi:Beta4Glucosyltransferase domain containing protein, partial [uncultured Caudovirales phage]
LGALVKSELATVQMSCDVMCYPTEFEEVSCITAMEAMHAGLPFLSSAHGALPETCEDTGSILLPLIDGNADEEAFITQLLAFLDDPSLLKVLSIKQKESAVRFTWEAAAKKLEFLIHDLFDRRSTSTATVLRSAIEKADIIYAKHLIENYPEVEDSGIGKAAIKEIAEMYNFADSDEAYAAHYAKHQAAYYDGPGANVIGEDITSMPRFRGIASFIGELSDDPKKQLEIFDYGCAHGHFVISLAKMFPQHHFTGMDISDRAIGKAIEWAKRDNVPNVSFVIGTAKDIVEKNYYDVVSACEVLEHVPNPHAIMDILRSSMKDGGTFMATTPFGRWEWIGIEAYKTGREHLHHFERDDLREILKEFKHEIVCAPSGFDQGKAEIGSWVWSFIEDKSSSLSQINYARKTDTYAPRQTISACLIVKNGESTIVQCIKSFIDVVDEVIVMVDPLTTDRTIEVVQNLANDNPYKSFIIEMGLSALTDGFDEARNLSISKASGDWILWIDADEILHKGFNLHQLLKSSANDGYAMAQVHYAIEPAQVLTTDMPCRLFRNSIGVKFYGVVHEHPEVEIGKAVPHTMARHDVKFLHNGYTDEETRRARYNRNLPLLHRDLKKHPERTLTKFLMLRDISQGMSFELQANGGHKVPGFDEDAEMGINLFEDILENAPLRIAIDAVQYYSGCVDLLGGGFTMDINLETKKDEAKDLASNTAVSGRFLNKKHYFKLLERISTEAVKHYESKYL